MTADEALRALKEGNRRFAENRLQNPRRGPERRAEISGAQRPLAAVITCSDSRVVPEIIFDQGLGDLFVVRVAGNAVDESVLGSVEFAALRLEIPLILVLGHTKCGALTAALSAPLHSGRVAALLKLLQPAVERSRRGDGDALENTIIANVHLTIDRLARTLREGAESGARPVVRVIGGVYDIATGRVSWMED